MKIKKDSSRRVFTRNKLLQADEYCKQFSIEQVVRKQKNSNKAERTMYIRVGGKIIVKNKRRYSFSEYSQRMALLAKYAGQFIDINNIAQHTENYEDLHYSFEEAIWDYCLPDGKHKIVAVADKAYAIRPFATKWRIGFYPVVSGIDDASWTNLRLGVFSSFDLALRGLAGAYPALNYLDNDAFSYVQEHLDKVKLLFRRKEETRNTILENIEKLKQKI